MLPRRVERELQGIPAIGRAHGGVCAGIDQHLGQRGPAELDRDVQRIPAAAAPPGRGGARFEQGGDGRGVTVDHGVNECGTAITAPVSIRVRAQREQAPHTRGVAACSGGEQQAVEFLWVRALEARIERRQIAEGARPIGLQQPGHAQPLGLDRVDAHERVLSVVKPAARSNRGMERATYRSATQWLRAHCIGTSRRSPPSPTRMLSSARWCSRR